MAHEFQITPLQFVQGSVIKHFTPQGNNDEERSLNKCEIRTGLLLILFSFYKRIYGKTKKIHTKVLI